MTSDVKQEELESFIQEIRSTILPYQNIESDKPSYVVTHLHLAKLHFALQQDRKAVYHLSECHGALLRHHAILEDIRREGWLGMEIPRSNLKWEYLSSTSDYAIREDEGLFDRLSEMPPEWTVVQLTRIPNDEDYNISHKSNPKLKELFVSRMHCGPNADEPLVGYIEWLQTGDNILDEVNESQSYLRKETTNFNVIKNRQKASKILEKAMANLDIDYLTDWTCVFLGKLQDVNLANQIRSKIDEVLKLFMHKVVLKAKVKLFLYLLAEGCHFITPILIRSSLEKQLPNIKDLKIKLFNEIIAIRESFDELRTCRRHPVILIVEEHLDRIPWECMNVLKEQAVTRITSIHFLHALFNAHKEHIDQGLRVIRDENINYYIVNPDGTLHQSEAQLKQFFASRLPHWQGLIGEKPSAQDMIKAITTSNTFMYCGHGSGCQFLHSFEIQKLNLGNSIQLLFGCSSAALNYLGGAVPMTGDLLHYSIAGSPCSLGMLYPVTSNDADTMTMTLANYWLPGTPIDLISNSKIENIKREPELLRLLPKVRSCCKSFSNGAAFISRGLPIKLVPGSEV